MAPVRKIYVFFFKNLCYFFKIHELVVNVLRLQDFPHKSGLMTSLKRLLLM